MIEKNVTRGANEGNNEAQKKSIGNQSTWTIAVLIVPIIFAVAGMVAIFYDADSRIFIIGMGVSLIFGFTLSSLARLIESSEKSARESDENSRLLSEISEKLNEINAQSTISQSLTDERLLSNTNWLLDGVSRTSDISSRYPAIAPFCEWKISQIESMVRDLVRQAEDGRVVIDDPARELTSSIELLRSASSREVLAISYEDTPFWGSNEGKRFLEEHRSAIARNVVITRIFIVDSDDENDLIPIMNAQHELGVIVYKVSAIHVRDLNPSDVVIYDGSLVRMGYNEDYTQSNMFKAAQLIVSPEIIRKQIQIFEALKARAELHIGNDTDEA